MRAGLPAAWTRSARCRDRISLNSPMPIKGVSSMPKHNIKRKINQIIRNKNERIFLCVSIATCENILVPHDYVDFQKKKRDFIEKNFGVDVIETLAAKEKL